MRRAHPMSRPTIMVACMIDLGSIAGLLDHQHALAAYCQRCDRWAVFDLARMVAAGLGDRRLPIKARCSVCGELGRLQVRPPVPTRGPGGWMEPSTTNTCRPPPPGQLLAPAGRT